MTQELFWLLVGVGMMVVPIVGCKFIDTDQVERTLIAYVIICGFIVSCGSLIVIAMRFGQSLPPMFPGGGR